MTTLDLHTGQHYESNRDNKVMDLWTENILSTTTFAAGLVERETFGGEWNSLFHN